ncbi:hypothetical protein KSS87_008272 [Heliosperma pusillum]|nr:hypothetical protein KSS87_008272 [Heliosperma pusillum]
MMKFEDFLMQSTEPQTRRIALEEEVEELQERLDGELKLNSVLRYALKGPLLSCPTFSALLPLKVRMLLTELELVEKEIGCLEARLGKLKRSLYREKLNLEAEVMQPRLSHHHRRKTLEEGRLSLNSISDMPTCSSARFKEKTENESLRFIGTKQNVILAEAGREEPNKISEELLQCLIKIFLKMKQVPSEGERVASDSKHTQNCINSRGISTKTTFSCKARSHSTIGNTTFNSHDLPDPASKAVNVRAYKNLLQITRSSLTTSQISDSYPATRKLRVLLQKLGYVDLTFLSHKQKLAFWINIYNACIMHAALNVGGIVLNALAIEHYLLRHPVDSKHDPTDEKEMLLRRAYGLQYPEPNITFALCRGNWSSPAVS